MARNDFNLGKAIAQGYAWTRTGKKVILKEIHIGTSLYPIFGTILSPYETPESKDGWMLTGRYRYRHSSCLDLTTKEPQ